MLLILPVGSSSMSAHENVHLQPCEDLRHDRGVPWESQDSMVHSNSEVDHIDKIKVLKRFEQTDKQL